jgi:hypothetical protein
MGTKKYILPLPRIVSRLSIPSPSLYRLSYPSSRNGMKINLSWYSTNKQYAMKTNGGVDIKIHVFLTSALVADDWSASCSYRVTFGKDPIIEWKGSWVNTRVDLDYMKKWKFLTLPGFELWPPRSSSPYPVAIRNALLQLFPERG